MTLRLTGAQVTRVREALVRFEEHDSQTLHSRFESGEGEHMPVETLVEGILKIVFPHVTVTQLDSH